MLVRHDNDCGYQHRGRAYAPLADTVGHWCSDLGLRVRSVATPYSRLVGAAAYYHPVSINRFMLNTALLSRLRRGLVGESCAGAWAQAQRVRFWEAMLRRAQPKAVVAISPHPALCQSGRRQNIPVHDLQNGVIDTASTWYSVMSSAPIDAEYLPTGILCWGDESAAEVNRWAPERGVAVHAVGNPWVDRFQEAAPTDTLVTEALAQLQLSESGRPRVLVSLQWGLREPHEGGEKFNGVMAGALEQAILAKADRVDWLVRMHPVQMRGETAVSVRSYLSRTFGALPGVEWEFRRKQTPF